MLLNDSAGNYVDRPIPGCQYFATKDNGEEFLVACVYNDIRIPGSGCTSCRFRFVKGDFCKGINCSEFPHEGGSGIHFREIRVR